MWVTKGWVGTWTVVLGITVAACNVPEAHADTPGITCEHRGGAHIERHGGKVEDDAYHRLHHEKLTCDDKSDEGKDYTPYERHEADRHADTDDRQDDGKHDDTPLPGHRDKPGYGCFLLRCG